MPCKSSTCRKRPARAREEAEEQPKKVKSIHPKRVEWKNGLKNAPPQPDWEGDMVRAFAAELAEIKEALEGREITLNIWSDCGGLDTEMFSLRRVASKVRELSGVNFKAKLFCACEEKMELRSFVATNHAPKHMSANMLDRDWVNKTFKCVWREDRVRMPEQGIDIYVCGFPCGPWTSHGLRKGFDDPASKCFWAAIKTIKILQPAIYVLENVFTLSSKDEEGQDFTLMQQHMQEELPNFAHHVNDKVDPVQKGYPMRRTRVLMTGGRGDVVEPERLDTALARMISRTNRVEFAYPDFVNMGARLDLGRLHQLPSGDEQVVLQKSPCTCSFHPMVFCEKHICTCMKCKKGDPRKMECEWRKKALNYISKPGRFPGITCTEDPDQTNPPHVLSEITYCQQLECFQNDPSRKSDCPSTPRERNMLNILARNPALGPLVTSNVCFNMNESIDYVNIGVGGMMQCLGMGSAPWSLPHGKLVNLFQVARLFGHDLDDFDPSDLSDCQLRTALGNSIHVANLGSVLFSCIVAALQGRIENVNKADPAGMWRSGGA